ncbi:hypothetical protein J2Z33_002558 [Rubellimicrobium aerolatum]|nr:hypothetical protein [Rubellimicrobium aerolatum]
MVRMVNLIQTASAFARHMESIDRTAMSRAVHPHLAALSPEGRRAESAATADGHPFPTNLDTDPPIGGLAPETQQDLLARAVAEGCEQARLDAARAAKRRPWAATRGPPRSRRTTTAQEQGRSANHESHPEIGSSRGPDDGRADGRGAPRASSLSGSATVPTAIAGST